MNRSIDADCVCVPKPFLRLLLSYFAEGIGEGDHLVEVVIKSLSESEVPRLQAEDVNRLVGLALQSGNVQLARMIGSFLRTAEEGPFQGLTLPETAMAVARHRK